MNQRIGIIDLGSNTARLIVMEYEPGLSFRLIDEVSETVRLASGVGDAGVLQDEPMERAVETLKMFHTFCHGTGVGTVLSVATSATREARNGQLLLDRLANEAGLTPRILSGTEEGYYGCLAAVNSLPLDHGFVIDIGGGSAQISALRNRQVVQSASRQAGAVRLFERYLLNDPPSKDDLKALRRGLGELFADLTWYRQQSGDVLVGIGGTVRNLARIDIKARNYPLDRLHGYVLTRERLAALTAKLVRRSARERATIPGLNGERADVILPGALTLLHLMEHGGFPSLVVSGAGVREGLFFEHFLQDAPPALKEAKQPLFADVRAFSVLNLARLYNYEEQHCLQVQSLALSLFDQLAPLHAYGAWERRLLADAALLHDIGVSVAYYDHHKHSAYLVLNAALYGVSHREQVLIALLTYYHRKGEPDVAAYSAVLEPGDELRLAQLGSLLRIAEYLERSKGQRVRALRVTLEADAVYVQTEVDGDARVEIWEANRRTSLFRRAWNKAIEIV